MRPTPTFTKRDTEPSKFSEYTIAIRKPQQTQVTVEPVLDILLVLDFWKGHKSRPIRRAVRLALKTGLTNICNIMYKLAPIKDFAYTAPGTVDKIKPYIARRFGDQSSYFVKIPFNKYFGQNKTYTQKTILRVFVNIVVLKIIFKIYVKYLNTSANMIIKYLLCTRSDSDSICDIFNHL